MEFYVRMCFDVLLEVLHPGDRRPLTKLERIGRCFHWTIEKYFPDVPFLRLNLELNPSEYFFLSTNTKGVDKMRRLRGQYFLMGPTVLVY